MIGLILDPKLATNAEITLEVVSSESHFDSLEAAWRELHQNVASSTAPLTWEWMREWWRTYGATYGAFPGGLHIILVKRAQSLIGILPLYLRVSKLTGFRSLRFLSTGEDSSEVVYPENLTLLARPEDCSVCLDVISKHIFSDFTQSWDECYFGIVEPRSSLLDLPKGKQLSIGIYRRQYQHESPRAETTSGFDAYLATLSASTRQHFRRLIRQADSKAIEFTVATSSDQAETFLAELISLHQSRWTEAGGLGAFSSQRKIQFHNSLAKLLVPKGAALLSKLSFDGAPIALLYGFINGAKFDFYQSGIDLTCTNLKSPGLLAHLLTMKYLSSQGVTIYDLLSGNSEYKQRLATTEIATSELKFLRLTPRTFVYSIASILKKLLSKLTNMSRVMPKLYR